MPTLFLNAMDDPIIRFDFHKQGFKMNPNVVLVTTEHGGHIGSKESLCGFDFWHIKPVAAFLASFIE